MPRKAEAASPALDAAADPHPPGEYHPRIPIAQLHESALNPRRRFHEASLQELASSIRAHGILTPLLARPTTNGAGPAFELAAGHRRYRAAGIAGLAELPVVVREMTDAQFVEVLTIENLQREDVHALEEAQGFADLIKHAGYDVARIAERVGKSIKYVYDRLKLLQLTPQLQQIFFDGEITAGHAILLARLSAEDQARALEATGALFTFEHVIEPPPGSEKLPVSLHPRGNEELDLDDPRKPMSVRELQGWIDQHVRFNVAADDVPDLFPETAAVVAPAIEQAEKVISITHNYHVHPEAKPESGERTYGPSSWKRADGERGSKTCDNSVMGVIVVGPGRGEAFRVCTAKKKCSVHWKSEQREAAKRAQATETGHTSEAASQYAKQREREDAERRRAEERRAAWKTATPQILEAVAAQLQKLQTGAKGSLGTFLIKQVAPYGRAGTSKYMEPGTSASDLVRFLGMLALEKEIATWDAEAQFPKLAKAFGVDVAKILKGETEPKFPKAAKKAAPKKKAKARR